MAYELDCRGLACPEPVVRCKRLIAEKHPADLTVMVDNAAACENVSRLLARNGYAVGDTRESEKLWRIEAKSGDDCGCRVEEQVSTARTAVVITTETLGRGSDELGLKLMENFLASLPELGESLWRVILLNGGVKLAARPGKALDALKTLSGSGVEILVCGTCLNFFELLEAKAVGETTNMMDVVTSLALADKVIRP